MKAFGINVGIPSRVQTRDAEFETVVVRRVGRNQTREFGCIRFAWVRRGKGAPQCYDSTVRFHCIGEYLSCDRENAHCLGAAL